MNNKILKRILLPAAILVWVFIMYKIYMSVFSVSYTMPVTVTKFVEKKEKTFIADTIALILSYDDPFLSDLKQKTRVHEYKPKVKPKKTKVENKLKWPEIKYLGTIKNKISGDESVSLNIGGCNIILLKGDKFSGILLNEICKDSIVVSFETEKKVIKLGV